MHRLLPTLILFAALACSAPTERGGPTVEPGVLVPIDYGFAATSVNASIFRTNSLVSHGNVQYAAYYDADGRVVLARRRIDEHRWEIHTTQYSGDVANAHNSISIGIDGEGVLHVAWNHHGAGLNYAVGIRAHALEIGEPGSMTGSREGRVTYPQFYRLPEGDLIFAYRDGGSGGGDVLLNRYHLASRTWTALKHPLIDGQGERNAYVNHLAFDGDGGWHMSWTWRETPDVATNHDVMYTVTRDEGATWLRSDGTAYHLPITAESAEIVVAIPQGSDLINQTSMAVDASGRPAIVTYWKPPGRPSPQYHLIFYDGVSWQLRQIYRREQPFRLGGDSRFGTRRIPFSRPLIVADDDDRLYVVLRDEELGDGVFVATSDDVSRQDWQVHRISPFPVGLWEPTHDPEVWGCRRHLHLFHQRVGQGDAETVEDIPPQMISVLEWIPPMHSYTHRRR